MHLMVGVEVIVIVVGGVVALVRPVFMLAAVAAGVVFLLFWPRARCPWFSS